MVDTVASQLLPTDAPPNFVPISTTSDGNCFYNAVSISLVGDESFALELRTRTSIALLQLKIYIYRHKQH